MKFASQEEIDETIKRDKKCAHLRGGILRHQVKSTVIPAEEITMSEEMLIQKQIAKVKNCLRECHMAVDDAELAAGMREMY